MIQLLKNTLMLAGIFAVAGANLSVEACGSTTAEEPKTEQADSAADKKESNEAAAPEAAPVAEKKEEAAKA